MNGNPARKAISAANGENTCDFTHTLEGEWEKIVGHVGFQYTSKDTHKDFIACLIGLPVEALGNNQYKSEGWDKKIFWIDVGDGAPMHVCAIYAPDYVEDGVTYDNFYWAPNFQYLPPGVQDDSQARPRAISSSIWRLFRFKSGFRIGNRFLFVPRSGQTKKQPTRNEWAAEDLLI